MALETATNIADLIATNPGINDPASRGDDHIRLIKQVLLNDLGSLDGALTVTADQINGMEAAYQTYTSTELSDLAFGEGNTGTVGLSGLVGDYQAADEAIQEQVTQNTANITALDAALDSFIASYLNRVYPVGSIYMNTSNATSPSTLMSFATWQAMGQGRCLIGAGGSSDGTETRNFTAGQGDGKFSHTLTVPQMPRHRIKLPTFNESGFVNGFVEAGGGSNNPTTTYTDYIGADEPHNNMQPYLVVYMWKRIA